MGDVTKEDLRDLRDTIVDQMRDGFSGVYERQDKTNGRLLKAEERGTEHDVKVKNLEREVFHRHRRRADPMSTAAAATTGVTQRDVRIAAVSLGSAFAILKALAWFAPVLKVVGLP